jgi:hypothetical protein
VAYSVSEVSGDTLTHPLTLELSEGGQYDVIKNNGFLLPVCVLLTDE